MKNRFPELFKQYKQARKETQADIAKRWGMNPTTLSRYANGYMGAFPLDLLEIFCDEMGITPNDVLWEDEPEIVDPQTPRRRNPRGGQ